MNEVYIKDAAKLLDRFHVSDSDLVRRNALTEFFRIYNEVIVTDSTEKINVDLGLTAFAIAWGSFSNRLVTTSDISLILDAPRAATHRRVQILIKKGLAEGVKDEYKSAYRLTAKGRKDTYEFLQSILKTMHASMLGFMDTLFVDEPQSRDP